MIYVPDPTIPESQFVDLLKKTKNNCLNLFSKSNFNRSKISSVAFEDIVEEQANVSAKGTLFDGNIERTGSGDFPDIVAKKYFGIEVKMTSGNKWSTIGNSVSESTRIQDIKRIYIFFGKFGGEVGIKFRPYEECLREITVTHNPRYQVDMDLEEGKTIFDMMKTSYEALRSEKYPIKKIKEYYRNNLAEGEELWWIDTPAEGSLRPVVKLFNNFKPKEKDDFRVESMVLFPEIFGEKQSKFERVAAHLLESRNAITSNIRDLFTAGGQMKRRVKGRNIELKRVLAHLYDEAKLISSTIEKMPLEDLYYYWSTKNIENKRIEFWKKLLNKNKDTGIKGIKVSDVFEAGLGAKK